jgi:hypothetical protein
VAGLELPPLEGAAPAAVGRGSGLVGRQFEAAAVRENKVTGEDVNPALALAFAFDDIFGPDPGRA